MAISYQLARGPQIPGLSNTHIWYVNKIDDSKNPDSGSDPMITVYAQFPGMYTEALAVRNSLNGV